MRRFAAPSATIARMLSSLRIGAWNLEHAIPKRRRELSSLLAAKDADVWVLTETHDSVVPEGARAAAHAVQRSPEAPQVRTGSRWVSIWSRFGELERVDLPGSDNERTVVARLMLADGRWILVYGTVLPWPGDLVHKGPEARLAETQRQINEWGVLRNRYPSDIFCIAGDFNADMGTGAYFGSRRVMDLLFGAFAVLQLDCVTSPDKAKPGDQAIPLIDHIALSASVSARTSIAHVWPAEPGELSDHGGVVVKVDFEQ